MINFGNIPFSYLCLSLLFSGFTLFALIKFIYIYFRTGRREILPLLLLSVGAFLYIISDTSSLIYYILTADFQSARHFINSRELSALVFLISLPYFLRQALIMKPFSRKIISAVLWAGVISAALILLLATSDTESLIGRYEPGPGFDYRNIVVIQEYTHLFIIKSILLLIYLLLAVCAFLYSSVYNKLKFPVNKILIGLLVLLYFAMSGIHHVLFFHNSGWYVNYYYPHIGTGIAIFILFISFGTDDIFNNYTAKIMKIKNDLAHILYDDSQLGIPNRNSFLNELQLKLDKLKKTGGKFSLVFIDIDDFQHINESFGEKAGDEILKLLTKRLIDYFASDRNLFRVGGDEFVFILDDADSDDEAVYFSQKIITSLRNPFSLFGSSYPVTASLGIIQVPRDGDNIETILNNAYSVIRDAKHIKNTYKVFTKEIVDYSSKKVSIVNLLRTSIATNQFTMFYQPIVDADGNIVYAESLLRCTNPDPSIGGPGEFIPLMEKAGIMKDVDDMVIRKVFNDIEMRIKNQFQISINLSSTQLINPDYSDFLTAFVKQQGIEPEQIILEVIENTLIENFSKGRESLLRLKRNGFKIALDDFGRGFSSLSYLAELPIDILKVDMAFVQSIPGDPKKEAIASHIMKLAHSLNLKVIAEGFETKEQFEFYRELGCDNYQGYYFSRPMPLDQLLIKYNKK